LATYGKPRFLGIVELDEDIFEGLDSDGQAVAASHRGEEVIAVMGALDEEQEREYRRMKTVSEHGDGPARGGDPVVSELEFVRAMTVEDRARWASRKETESGILRDAQEMSEWHHLEIKLIDAETMMDGKKLFFYFTSETRIDFRTLVKDLARKFRTRIELRQMGVRDEARIIRGMASCGLPCCCGYWLNQFAPIGIKMVKEQNIALNPAKISGICGRLMCCRSFEHKVYKNLWNGLPGPGSKIKTPAGNYIVTAMDIAREAVRCPKPGGGDVAVPIGMFQDFRKAVTNGEEWELPESELEAENERAEMKRRDCACGRNIEFRGIRETAPDVKPREASGERKANDSSERHSAHDAASPHVSGGERARVRGRGHREGRGNKQESRVLLPQEAKPERARRPKPAESVKEASSAENAAVPAISPRSRHRRRRPRRHGPSGAPDAPQ
jgi:cell fate regulator YaaT (PSP1 superfamily)